MLLFVTYMTPLQDPHVTVRMSTAGRRAIFLQDPHVAAHAFIIAADACRYNAVSVPLSRRKRC